MKSKYFHLVLIVVFLAAGCAQFPGRKGPVYTGQAPAPRPLIDREDLVRKMVALQQKLQENRISEEDRPGAEALLEVYKLLQDAPFPSPNDSPYSRLIARIYLRLERIESAFQSPRNLGPSGEKTVMEAYRKKRQRILETYLSGNSRGVINQVLSLKNRFGDGALTPGINLVFAVSLANQGLFKEAIETGEVLAKKLEKRPDLLILQGKLATWYSRLGKEDAAMLRYDKMNDLMDDRTALLNRLKEELHAPSKRQKAMHLPLPRVLKKVEENLRERAFDDAKTLLTQKREDPSLSVAEKDTIDKALVRVERAKQAFEGKEKDALEKVRRLLEKEQYDQALDLLKNLKSEGFEGYQVSELERRATEGFIRRRRKKAAALFLRARTAGSSLEKKEYLRQSRNILQQLLDKFPSSPSRDKILQNLDMVDREMGKW